MLAEEMCQLGLAAASWGVKTLLNFFEHKEVRFTKALIEQIHLCLTGFTMHLFTAARHTEKLFYA